MKNSDSHIETNANPDNALLSRRKWLGLAAGASLGSGLLALGQTARATSPASQPSHSHSPHAVHPAIDHSLGARTYNIRDFGAKGDGTTLDTAAVQAAIDACHKDQGGTVLVPAGALDRKSTRLNSSHRL